MKKFFNADDTPQAIQMLQHSSEENPVESGQKSPSPDESSIEGTPGYPDQREMFLLIDSPQVKQEECSGSVTRHDAQDLSDF